MKFDDYSFNYIIIAAVLANVLACLVVEFIIVRVIDYYWRKRKLRRLIERINKLEEKAKLSDSTETIPLSELHLVSKENKK